MPGVYRIAADLRGLHYALKEFLFDLDNKNNKINLATVHSKAQLSLSLSMRKKGQTLTQLLTIHDISITI